MPISNPDLAEAQRQMRGMPDDVLKQYATQPNKGNETMRLAATMTLRENAERKARLDNAQARLMGGQSTVVQDLVNNKPVKTGYDVQPAPKQPMPQQGPANPSPNIAPPPQGQRTLPVQGFAPGGIVLSALPEAMRRRRGQLMQRAGSGLGITDIPGSFKNPARPQSGQYLRQQHQNVAPYGTADIMSDIETRPPVSINPYEVPSGIKQDLSRAWDATVDFFQRKGTPTPAGDMRPSPRLDLSAGARKLTDSDKAELARAKREYDERMAASQTPRTPATSTYLSGPQATPNLTGDPSAQAPSMRPKRDETPLARAERARALAEYNRRMAGTSGGDITQDINAMPATEGGLPSVRSQVVPPVITPKTIAETAGPLPGDLRRDLARVRKDVLPTISDADLGLADETEAPPEFQGPVKPVKLPTAAQSIVSGNDAGLPKGVNLREKFAAELKPVALKQVEGESFSDMYERFLAIERGRPDEVGQHLAKMKSRLERTEENRGNMVMMDIALGLLNPSERARGNFLSSLGEAGQKALKNLRTRDKDFREAEIQYLSLKEARDSRQRQTAQMLTAGTISKQQADLQAAQNERQYQTDLQKFNIELDFRREMKQADLGKPTQFIRNWEFIFDKPRKDWTDKERDVAKSSLLAKGNAHMNSQVNTAAMSIARQRLRWRTDHSSIPQDLSSQIVPGTKSKDNPDGVMFGIAITDPKYSSQVEAMTKQWYIDTYAQDPVWAGAILRAFGTGGASGRTPQKIARVGDKKLAPYQAPGS